MDGRRPANHAHHPCGCAAVEPGDRPPPRSSPRRMARPVLSAVLLLLLPCAGSRAQQSEGVEDSVGPALICNTSQQLNRFVDLVNVGREAADALRLVNEEAQNPIACGNALAAFEIGKPVAEVKLLGELVSIVEVKILALSDGSEWMQVQPTTQYTIRRHPAETL